MKMEEIIDNRGLLTFLIHILNNLESTGDTLTNIMEIRLLNDFPPQYQHSPYNKRKSKINY